MSEHKEDDKPNVIYLKFENHKIPEFKEVKNKDWIYFGEDNLYSDYLIELYLKCAKHGAIVNGKCNYIYGAGLTVKQDTATIEQRAVTTKFITKLSSFIQETIKDFEIFNSFAIEIIYNKKGKDIANFAYIPISKIRTNKDESMYYFSNNWKSDKRQEKDTTGFKEIPPFDFDNKKGSQLFVFKVKSPKNGVDKNVYAIPNYIASTAAIETDIEIGNFHLNNIKSGFSVGTIINFNNGTPPPEAQASIEKQVKKKTTGTDRAGGLLITFNKSTENAPTITSFTPSDLDKQFIEISKRIDQEIFTSHTISSPILFGVSTPGALGQRNEMVDAYELFQNTYVSIRQGILEEVINGLSSLFGIANKIEFKKITPIKSLIPNELMIQAYTPSEIREALGLKALDKNANVNTQSVIDAINTLSPLVANKVLDSMTAAEIRGLVGLKEPLINTTTSEQTIFKKEVEYEILFEREYKGQSESDCFKAFEKLKFAKELTKVEQSIVDLLDKDPLTTSEAIAKVTKVSVEDVNKMIKSLTKGGYLKTSGSPTNKGNKASEDAPTAPLEIKYRYTWRADIPINQRDTAAHPSREFCKEFMKKTELPSQWLSHSQIERLDNGQDLDVWGSRGGWWNKGGANIPYCRHQWSQMVVKIKD